MQLNVGLAGKTVVTGLNWSVIAKDGPGRKKDIKKACVESGFTLGVTVDGNDLGAVGLCVKKSDYPSGAAMLAAANALAVKDRAFGDTNTNANWILVEKLIGGDKAGMYWMCAISDGVPVPGTDIVEPLSATSAKLAELVEILENVEIFSIEQEILDYVAGASPAFEKGFADLIANVSVAKSFKPQKILGVPDWVGFAFIGLAAVVLIGVGYSYVSEQQANEVKRAKINRDKDNQARIRREEESRKSKEYQELDKRALLSEFDKLKQSLSRSPAVVANAWANAIDTIYVDNGGWTVQSVSCDLNACNVQLMRDAMNGTNLSLKSLVPNVEFSDNGDASYSIPLKIDATRAVGLNQLPAWPEFALTTGSTLQELHMSSLVDAQFGPRKEIVYRPPALQVQPSSSGAINSALNSVSSGVSGPQAPVNQAPRGIGFMSGVITVKGNSLWQLRDSVDYLKGDEFVFDNIKADFSRSAGEASWTINGTYYLKATSIQAALGVVNSISTQVAQPVLISGAIPPGVGPTPPVNQSFTAIPAKKQ